LFDPRVDRDLAARINEEQLGAGRRRTEAQSPQPEFEAGIPF
jgi:hypothetical protein